MMLAAIGPKMRSPLEIDAIEQEAKITRYSSESAALGRGHEAGALELETLVHEQRRVAAVVEDHRRPACAGPAQQLLGAPPVLLEGLALPGEDRHAGGPVDRAVRSDHDRGRGVVLSGKDVAADPAHVGAEFDERLDQDRGLDRHVQRARNTSASEGLARSELGAHGHEAGHFVLGKSYLGATEVGQ